jgi:hypothetical protein
VVRRLLAHVLRLLLGVARALARPLAELSPGERWLLLAVGALHAVGIGWGLPASDGWDVDGIAPRDFLSGMVKTVTPGDYFTYPPLHLLLLTVLTLPVTLVALLRAPSLSPHDVVQVFVAVPVMTTFAFVARAVNLLMSLGIVLLMGNLARALGGPRARPWAMAIAGVEVAGTYYAHTSNLDVPALFWASCALLALVEALLADRPTSLRRVAVLVACAVASKDQAYAIFLLAMPCVLSLWALERRRAGALPELLRETLWLVGLGVFLVLLLDGALFNPTGFLARVRFLTGPASQDFAQFSKDWPGRLAAFREAATFLPNHYPVALAPLFALGAALAVGRARGRARVAALVPLLAILSFTLAFNCVARRVEERFMLPQMQLLSVYGGCAVAGLLELGEVARRRALGVAVKVAAAAGVALGLRLSATVVANLLGDARYEAEAFLRANVRDGEVIEIYGGNVYLPRFPGQARVERVGPGPTDARNPMPDITERRDALGAIDARRPRWVVVSTGYAWRFLRVAQDEHEPAGHVLPESQRMSLADADATNHMRALFASAAGYEVAHIARYQGSPLLPPRPLHASLACDVWIFRRR